MPLGLLCSMASRPPSRSRRCRLQLKVSKKEYLVCQPTSHQHGLVEVTSPLRFPSAYEGPDGNIIAVGAKRCRCGEVLFQPKTSIRSRTFQCLRLTVPFRRTLVRHETGTSSLFAADASISRKSCLYQVPLVYVQPIPRHFSAEQDEVCHLHP